MSLRPRGFTIIEILMVIMILGILAAVAMPRFYDLTTEARNASDEYTMGAVKETVSNLYLQSALSGTPAYPTMAEVANNLIQPVFFNGITPNEWSYIVFGGANVIYCPHSTEENRRIWVYFQTDVGIYTAGSVLEFGLGPHT